MTPEFGNTIPHTDSASFILSRPDNAPGVPKLIRWHCPLRVWHYTRWKKISWSIYKDKRPISGARALIRKIVYTRELKEQEFIETLVATDIAIEPEKAQVYKDSLIHISLKPFIGNRVMYIDEDAFGIESVADRVYFEWQSEGPKEWRKLVIAVRKLIENFEIIEKENHGA